MKKTWSFIKFTLWSILIILSGKVFFDVGIATNSQVENSLRDVIGNNLIFIIVIVVIIEFLYIVRETGKANKNNDKEGIL